MSYFWPFLASFGLSVGLTAIIRPLAVKFGIVDKPDAVRRLHARPTPLLGGWAVLVAILAVLLWQRQVLVAGNLTYEHWLGVALGAVLLMVGGTLDDKYDLSSSQQIIWPVLACLAVIAGGVGIEKITNPLSGLIFLNQWQIPLGVWGGHAHYFNVIADSFTFVWLMGMIFTTKLLDGLDGLSSGVGAVGALIIFLFTVTTRYYQPDIALAALVLAGALLGFLVWNWHPAKIFIGDGGSLLIGFALGVLSIISGGKIAIALLVMGLPILDVVWTFIRRWSRGKNPLRAADRGHLHFKLLDSGLGPRRTVIVYCGLAALFGLSALFLQSRGKLLALLILGGVMLVMIIWFAWLDKKEKIT